MSSCDACGKSENMPYQCHHCGGTFCAEHRLPEAHDCPGLQNWEDPGGVFDSGFDDSVEDRGGSGGLAARLPLDTGTGGVMGYFRGNMTYVFLGLMWVTYFLQYIVFPLIGIPRPAPGNPSPVWSAVFTLQPDHPLYVWTWFTHIFAHGPGFMHIAGNSLIIFFFGRIVERHLGTKRFTAFFLISGVIAGLAQMGLAYADVLLLGAESLGPGGLGASGAGLAIMGFLSVINPDLRVYLWFLIPVPIWVITIFYFGTSIMGITGYGGGIVGGNVAHMAHLAGLLAGLIYGKKMKGERRAPQQLQFGGGGRGPGGPGGPGRGRF